MFYEFKHFGTRDYLKIYHGHNLKFEKHLHQSYEFLAVLEGEMQVSVDNATYTLHSGDCALVFPNQIHCVDSVSSRNIACIFSTELVKTFTSATRGRIPQSNFFRPDDRIIQVIDTFSERAPVLEKKAVLYDLCAQFDKNAVYLDRPSDDKNLLYDIFNFVEKSYEGDCTLEALSGKTHFSYSYLSRYFKKTTGIAFNEYVNQYRIANACYMLANTEESILSCSLESGYSSLRSFNRNFARFMGTTPDKYRQENKR